MGKDKPIIMTPNHSVSMGMPAESLSGLYQFFDVLCLPTVGEGFGIPLIEGMASGCPIVTTDCSVTSEIIGQAGILVEPGHYEIMTKDNEMLRPIPSISAMVEAFNYLYNHKDVYDAMSKRGVQRAKAMFSNWNIPFWEEKIVKAQEIIEKSQRKSKGLDFDLDLYEEVR